MDFPPLNDGKMGRVVTKHYLNLSFILNPNHFSLLSFLIYQSKADNTVEYSTRLLLMYQKSITAGTEFYGSANESLNVSPPKSRLYFQYLIENGLLLPTTEPKQFMINPCLTYSKLYVKAEFYKEWSQIYIGTQYNSVTKCWGWGTEIELLIKAYFDHVNNNMQRRKQSL